MDKANPDKTQRSNRRRRTRKDLLQAASRLMQQGRKPSLEEVAEAALVSRATAYRYFANAEALLLEASLDVAVPSPAQLFHDSQETDPIKRLETVEAAFHDMMVAHEVPLRIMLARSLEQAISDEDNDDLPRRQNRRSPLIEAALTPARNQFDSRTLDVLSKALALLVGTESMVVCKDVLQLNDDKAQAVKRWAIRALVNAARSVRNPR